MGLFSQFIILSGIIGFTMVAIGGSTNTSNQYVSQRLNCKNKIRVIFASDTWDTQIGGKNSPRLINQDRFFNALMEKIVSTVDGK